MILWYIHGGGEQCQKNRDLETFYERFLHLRSKEFQGTLLLLSIPIASIMIPLTVWMVTSRSNSRGKKEALVQEMETEDSKTDNMEHFKDEILIETVMDQLAVSNFISTPAVSFSEAKLWSFYLYCIKFKMGSMHHRKMQKFDLNTKLYSSIICEMLWMQENWWKYET